LSVEVETESLTEVVAEEGSFELTEGKDDDGTVVNESFEWSALFLKTSSHESAVLSLTVLLSAGEEGTDKLEEI